MNDPLVPLLVAAAVLPASIVLFWVAAGSLSPRRANLVAWVFYYDLLLLSFVGATAAAMGTPHYLFDRASDPSVQRAFFAVCYVMLALPAAMIAMQVFVLRRLPRRRLRTYFGRGLDPTDPRRASAERYVWMALSLVAAAATAYTFVVVGQLPFLSVLGVDDGGASFLRLRQDARFGFEGNVQVRNLLALILGPLTSYVAFAHALRRPSVVNVAWTVLATLVAVAAVTYSGEKSPLLLYLLGLGFVFGYARGGFRWRDLAAMGATAVAGVAGLYLLTSATLPLGFTIGPIGRQLFSQIAPLALHFDTFPSRIGFLGGASFPQWMAELLGRDHLRSGRAVMIEFNPEGVAAGEAGVMNTLFVGEAWANFGWLGLLAAPFVVGAVIAVIHHVFLALPKTPAYVGALAYLTLRLPITGGFVDFLWNVGWLFLVLLLVAVIVAASVVVDATRAHRRGGEAHA